MNFLDILNQAKENAANIKDKNTSYESRKDLESGVYPVEVELKLHISQKTGNVGLIPTFKVLDPNNLANVKGFASHISKMSGMWLMDKTTKTFFNEKGHLTSGMKNLMQLFTVATGVKQDNPTTILETLHSGFKDKLIKDDTIKVYTFSNRILASVINTEIAVTKKNPATNVYEDTGDVRVVPSVKDVYLFREGSPEDTWLSVAEILKDKAIGKDFTACKAKIKPDFVEKLSTKNNSKKNPAPEPKSTPTYSTDDGFGE